MRVFEVARRGLAWLLVVAIGTGENQAQEDDKTLRVFVFAGQSNMVGSDSRVEDIELFPPFAGLGEPQKDCCSPIASGARRRASPTGGSRCNRWTGWSGRS